MQTDSEILNPGLYRLHRLFFIAFTSFAVIMALIGIRLAFGDGEDAAIGFVGMGLLPFSALHWYAAKGAKNGAKSGKIISRVIGTFWLFGIPIGTILGIYVWYKTADSWKPSESRNNEPA